jgi:hypothetical protein
MLPSCAAKTLVPTQRHIQDFIDKETQPRVCNKHVADEEISAACVTHDSYTIGTRGASAICLCTCLFGSDNRIDLVHFMQVLVADKLSSVKS